MELGDAIESALTKVGITKDRVSSWLGRPCNCQERQDKLNDLSRWARRVTKGHIDSATKYLKEILDE